eukprot:829976-Pyramimonas_sp.AAC.1
MTTRVWIDHAHDPALVSDHFPLVIELDLLATTSEGPRPTVSGAEAGLRQLPLVGRTLGVTFLVAAVVTSFFYSSLV